MLEENDALAAEAAGEEDEDGTRLEGGAGFGRVDRFANLMRQRISSIFVTEFKLVVARAICKLISNDRLRRATPDGHSSSKQVLESIEPASGTCNIPSWACIHPPQDSTSSPFVCGEVFLARP